MSATHHQHHHHHHKAKSHDNNPLGVNGYDHKGQHVHKRYYAHTRAQSGSPMDESTGGPSYYSPGSPGQPQQSPQFAYGADGTLYRNPNDMMYAPAMQQYPVPNGAAAASPPPPPQDYAATDARRRMGTTRHHHHHGREGHRTRHYRKSRVQEGGAGDGRNDGSSSSSEDGDDQQQQQQQDGADDDESQVSWNSAERCVSLVVRVTWEGTRGSLKEMSGKSGRMYTRKLFVKSEPILNAIAEKISDRDKLNSSHTTVTIRKITVVSRSSNMPHDCGIRMHAPVEGLNMNMNYIMASSQESFMYIIPGDCREDANVNDVVYTASKKIYSKLISGLGGVSVASVRSSVSELKKNSEFLYVDVGSKLADVVIQTHDAIKSGAKGLEDPKLNVDENGEPIVINEGDVQLIRVSRKFIDTFIEQYKESVVNVTKPVDLKSIELEACHEDNSIDIGVPKYQQDTTFSPTRGNKMAITLRIDFLPRTAN